MKKTVLATLLLAISASAMADAPRPTSAEPLEQLRVTHAHDWRSAAVKLAEAISTSPDLSGKSVKLVSVGQSAFMTGLESFLSSELYKRGVGVTSGTADANVLLATQFVGHAATNEHDRLAPFSSTAKAAGVVTLNEVLRNMNFNGSILAFGAMHDLYTFANRNTAVEEIIVTASAETGSFRYADSYYVLASESQMYRDSGLRSTNLRVK